MTVINVIACALVGSACWWLANRSLMSRTGRPTSRMVETAVMFIVGLAFFANAVIEAVG